MIRAALFVASLARLPCPETVAEGHAYLTLFSEPRVWATTDTSSRASVYNGCLERAQALADTMAATKGCTLEKLGCFTHIYGAHEALREIEARGQNGTGPVLSAFWGKARATALENMVGIVEVCEAKFRDMVVDGRLVEVTPK